MKDQVPSCCSTVCFNDHKILSLKEGLKPLDELQKMAEVFKVLGHPVRLSIVNVLAQDDCCVCDLANVLDIPVSTVSQHLKGLRQAGVVSARQEGKLVICSLADTINIEALSPVLEPQLLSRIRGS